MTAADLRLIAFAQRPCVRSLPFEPPCHEGGLMGTASFAVGGTITRRLDVVWHYDESSGLTVDALGGDAQTLYGGTLELTGQVADAILARLRTA